MDTRRRTRTESTRKPARLLTAALCGVLAASPPAVGQAAGQGSEALQAAAVLAQQGHLKQAKAATEAVLRQHPRDVDAYNLLGIVESEAGDANAALAAFDDALKIAPASVKARNNLGNLYASQKQFAAAEREYRAALRLKPADRDANYGLGTLLMAEGHPAAAIPCFERVRPADQATRLRLIEAYLSSGRKAEGLRLAAELSAENSKDVKLHFTLGMLLAGQKQYGAAELELEKADALQPDTFAILYALGQSYFLDKQYGRAQLQLAQALRVQPHSTGAMYLLAETEWSEGQPLEALQVLVRAHKLDGKNTDIILLMGQISMAQGYYEDAIPLLESGVRIAPQRADLRSALGESYFKADEMEKAIQTFATVVKTDPSARAYSFLGLAHTYSGRFDAAKEDFQNGLRLDAKCSFCLFNLGYIAERQGDTAGAAATFRKVLSWDPNFADALLELGNLDIQSEHYAEAEALLTRYVRVSASPAPGYYKLALVERKLHKTAEANADLAEFEKSAKSGSHKTYLYENLFDYLDNRAQLPAKAREQEDLQELIGQNQKHPGQPELLYMLAQAYLEAGQTEEAQATIAQLNQIKAGDARTLAGAGVLLARFGLYDDAIRQFEAAVAADPKSDDAKFDLANALFRKGDYSDALQVSQQVSAQERGDDAYLALVADIDAHLGQMTEAETLEREAIERSPDDDQHYLSLSLMQLRAGDLAGARETLMEGRARVPASGKIAWGLGLAAVMQGNTAEAAADFQKAVELLPEWAGSYSMLGLLYFQTGQIAQAREVLERLRRSGATGGLDVDRIEAALNAAPATTAEASLTMEQRKQLLGMALMLASRTL